MTGRANDLGTPTQLTKLLGTLMILVAWLVMVDFRHTIMPCETPEFRNHDSSTIKILDESIILYYIFNLSSETISLELPPSSSRTGGV